MDRPVITDDVEARRDLGSHRTKPDWRVSSHSLPFSELSDDEFEIFCFLLIRQENPDDRVRYYGKTGDAGRDIVHVQQDGKSRLIQCKRYTSNVGIGDVRAELAKLFYNIANKVIPLHFDEVVFYVNPDLTSPAIDLLDDPTQWRAVALDALTKHIGNQPTEKLLQFAQSWWPDFSHENALRLTERCEIYPNLRDEFFGVRKVIDASRKNLREDLQEQIKPVQDGISKICSLIESDQKRGPADSDSFVDYKKLRRLFQNASRSLLTWPTTLGRDVHILRPELNRLMDQIQSNEASTTMLLGAPGSGKSALLAVLGQRATQTGFSVLAIKADKLRLSVDSPAGLAQELRLPDLVESCVRQVASKGKVLVLLDQLDALADLLDLRSGRLNVLLELIHGLHGLSDIHLVCSCREFEYRHDTRLAALNANELRLQLPAWDNVAQVLKGIEIDAHNWPEPLRESLRPPQNLKIFLDRFQGTLEDQVFTSYQEMLDDLWRQKVTNPGGLAGRSSLLLDMAAMMSDEECLWLPAVRFEEREQIMLSLVSAGILTRPDDGPRIGFQHQTLFEHARARAFAKGNGSLASHVLERQDSLFVRPTLWSTLTYLRSAARTTYAAEMTTLLNSPLRLHVKYLLIEFMGQVRDPGDDEATWYFGWLNDSEYRAKALHALRGNAGWFDRIKDTYLPALMRSNQDEAWPVILVLSNAWPFARQSCIDLIINEWLDDVKNDTLILNTLRYANDWDESTLELAITVVSRTDVHDGYVAMLASDIDKVHPEMVPRFLAAQLTRQIEALEAAPDPETEPIPPDATEMDQLVLAATHRTNQRFQDNLDRQYSYHNLPKIAKAAPHEFLNSLWPWFLKALAHVLQEPHSTIREYRRDECHGSTLDEEDHQYYTFFSAFEKAICRLAATDHAAFLTFARSHCRYDAMVIQCLLCRGYKEIVETAPDACLEFLLADSRRFSLGSVLDDDGDTRMLISHLVPYLDEQQMCQLEQSIIAWSGYYPNLPDKDADTAVRRSEFDRRLRMRLLKSIPPEKLSPKTQLLVQEEERALGDSWVREKATTGFHTIGSKVSLEQMEELRNEAIVGLFDDLPDSTECHDPRDWLRGGSIQLSQVLEEFAKKHPSRAVALLPRFASGTQERPAGYIIRALRDGDLTASELYRLILDLDSRGFSGEEFRDHAGHALARRAGIEEGLPDDICALLERWLASAESPDDDWKDEDRKNHEREPQSILWIPSGGYLLPNGTYWFLRALTYGLLRRKPPLCSRWLYDLEQHVERKDSTRTWQVLTDDLRFLRTCKRNRVARFLTRLFERFPAVRDSRFGAILLARLRSFLTAKTYREFLGAMRDGQWSQGPQAYGELLALIHLTGKAKWAASEVDSALSVSAGGTGISGHFPGRDDSSGSKRLAIEIGIAFAAANLWKEQGYRERATELLVALSRTANGDLAKAIMTLFFVTDYLCVDDNTRRILDAVSSNSSLLSATNDCFLVEKLGDLVTAERERVYRICDEIVRLRGKDLVGMQDSFVWSTSHLTDIAITLQRTGGAYREKGLTLFEQLLVLGVSDAQTVLDELDRRPRNVPSRAVFRRSRRNS